MQYRNTNDVTQKKGKKKMMFPQEEAKLEQIFDHKNAPKMLEFKRVVKIRIAQMHSCWIKWKLVMVMVKMMKRWKKVRCW